MDYLRVCVIEICKLLRQARMHIVDELESEDRLQESADKNRFFVSVNHIVAMHYQQPDCPGSDEKIEKQLEHRRPRLDRP
jgi:hypothetical protein